MITTKITKPSTILNAIKSFFSKKSHNHKRDTNKVNKYNPKGEKDLRGFQNLQRMNEKEKSYSSLHSRQYNPLSLYGVFSHLPNSTARLLGRSATHPSTEIASDSLYLPKIYPDSIPIYDSINKSSPYLVANKLLTRVSPSLIVLFSSEPSLALLTYAPFAYLYLTTNWKTVKHLVIKCELLPHTEEIAYQKLTIWGGIRTRKTSISELEYVEFRDVFGENSHSEKSVRGLYNRDVAFRERESKELLLFDKHGFWNEEGVNHKLLI